MPTFEELDAAWANNNANPYGSTPTTTTNTVPSLSTTTNPTPVTTPTGYDPRWDAIGGTSSTGNLDPSTDPRWDLNNITSGSTGPTNPWNPSTTNSSNTLSTAYNYTPSVTNPPNAPVNPQAPSYLNSLGDMYKRTFTDPNSMWNEYSQGQGVAFNQGAGRAMAKAGRTGMLPTLNALAHQDYMSNYLPSVRKDLAPGLGYENTWNQNLTQKYGQDQDFAQKTFGTEASMYGQNLTYSSNMAQVAAQVQDIGVKHELGLLDNMMKQYGIDNDTQQQIFASMASMFPKMTDADQAAMVAELKLALALNKTGNQTLADFNNPIGQGTTPLATTATTTPAATTPSGYDEYANFGYQG